MFTASWMTYQRKRDREKKAAMRIAAKLEVKYKGLDQPIIWHVLGSQERVGRGREN